MEKEKITTQQQEVMKYYRQGVSGHSSVLPNPMLNPLATTLALSDRRHDISNFLRRPVDVLSISWTPQLKAGEELVVKGIEVPKVYCSNSMVKDKLAGFLGFRGLVRVKVMINAQKFQQGALMLYWIPNYDGMKSKADMIQASLSGKSGCGHIIIKCEGGTEQVLDIPYANPNMFYNLTTGEGGYGRLFLTPLLQLVSTDNSPVGIRIQMWVEQAEPIFPTSAYPPPQLVQSQSVSQQEEESKHPGTTSVESSSVSATLKNIAGIIDKPSLKPSYLAATTANLLELAGFSKPTHTAPIQRCSLRSNSFMANYNGEFMGHQMALAANNELASMPAPAGTKDTEMLIQNIVRIPTYYKTFTVNTLNHASPSKQNDIVFNDFVHPMKFVPSSNAPGGVLDSTFVGYTAASFSQWKGRIDYHFTVAKTGFHSGTLRVLFVPGAYIDSLGTPDKDPLFNFEKCYQKTYDLRDLSDFSFSVPWSSLKPYLNCVNPYGSIALSKTVGEEVYSTGTLVVDVFIPITCPKTSVSDSISVAVWVSGGEDLQFANPTAPSIYPYTAPPPPPSQSLTTSTTVQSQSFSLNDDTERPVAYQTGPVETDIGQVQDGLDASAMCTGEVVDTIKALTLRFGPFAIVEGLDTNHALTIAPYNFSKPRTDLTSDQVFDYLDYFSFLYAFYRGSIRLSMKPAFPDSRVPYYRMIMRSSINNCYPPGSIPKLSINTIASLPSQLRRGPFSSVFSRPTIEGLVDLSNPFYSLSCLAPAKVQEQTMTSVAMADYPSPLCTVIPCTADTSLDPSVGVAEIFRSAADDFTFHYLVGPPQVAILPDSGVTIPYLKFNKLMTFTGVFNNGNQNFQGLFGLENFEVSKTVDSTFYSPPQQFLAVTADSSELYVLPGNLAYNFWNPDKTSFVRVGGSYWKGDPKLQICFTNPGFTFAKTNAKPNWIISPAQVLPASPNVQSQPNPCMRFASAEVESDFDGKKFTIPGQGEVAWYEYFDLKIPLLAALSDGNLLATAIILPVGYRIKLVPHVQPNDVDVIVKVEDSASVELGRIIVNVKTELGARAGILTHMICKTN